jgi:hypothetical protein
MTTEATPAARRRPKPPGAWPVAVGALATFLVVITLLAVQLRRGQDPALGAAASAPATPAPKRVLVRRIVKRVVLTRVIPPPASSGGGGSADQAGVVGAAPAVQPSARPSPTPVAAAPAPAAAAPAPAPAAPAPVTTRSS